MVKYIILRPVAVLTICLAFLIVGLFSIQDIPISLLPDIEIPQIIVQTKANGFSSSEVENNISSPLRSNLSQINGLDKIQTYSSEGISQLKLIFNYGENLNYSFIKVNEKIDVSLNSLPKLIEKPIAIKSNISDIPILKIFVNHKNRDLSQISPYCELVIKKRLEQLKSVAFVDVSGGVHQEIEIEVKKNVLYKHGLKIQDISNALSENNIESSSFQTQENGYQYTYELNSKIRSLEDIKNILLNIKGKLIYLKDIANISFQKSKDEGEVIINGKPGVVLAVVKKKNARIDQLKKEVTEVLDDFIREQPDLMFNIFGDQSSLLNIAMDNLFSSLILGTIIAIILVFLFFNNYIAPVVIGIAIPFSLTISILFLYLFDISINIVSLSGLILGVGMMIDNSIIVVDNIQQYRAKGYSLLTACSTGATKVISPLFTSMLTTCSVFLPVIFVGGISGALFYDQAVSVSIGLISSLLVSIFVIPVVYFRYGKRKTKKSRKLYFKNIESTYLNLHSFFKRKKILIYGISAFSILLGCLSFLNLKTEILPQISKAESMVKIKWKDNPTIEKNKKLTKSYLSNFKGMTNYVSFIGRQQFILQNEFDNQNDESNTLFEVSSSVDLTNTENGMKKLCKKNPNIKKIDFFSAPNLFNQIFPTNEIQTSVQISKKGSKEIISKEDFLKISKLIGHNLEDQIVFKTGKNIAIDFEKLVHYNLEYSEVIFFIRSLLNRNIIGYANIREQTMPLKIKLDNSATRDLFSSEFIQNRNGDLIPLNEIIKSNSDEDFEIISGDENGSYLLLNLDELAEERSFILDSIKNAIKLDSKFDLKISGNSAESKEFNSKYIWVLIVSFLLLYFILSAQFESLLLPLIILIEIPIDIGASLFTLWIFGASINIMAIIGIVVMCGVIINDSILKIYAINDCIKEKLPVDEAIRKAGVSRFKAILMTSLTTILALLPFVFMSGIGADLQLPLALAIIGGMTVGTIISLFLIPLLYKKFVK